jgi:tetratricopeptide (TPR) repeat protein
VLSLVAGRREDEGRFDESLELLRRAKAAAPDAPGILNALGLCLMRLGRAVEAEAEYDLALAADPNFAPAIANRGTALVMQGRLDEARAACERALALEPGNLVALAELAALALQRGDSGEARALAEQVAARQPGFPGAMLVLAGADLAEGRAAAAEARLRLLLRDDKVQPIDQAMARGLLGDALDAQGRHAEAFASWSVANRLRKAHHREAYGRRAGTLAQVRRLTAGLEGKRIAMAWGRGGESKAKRHVFLAGFPRSGMTPIGQILEGHDEVVALSGKECLIDAERAWLADPSRFAALLAAPDAELDAWRDAYWRRVAAEGVDVAGRVFVDSHPFHSFELPLIARLFPEARIVVARRDPRDIVLSCFRHRLRLSDPVYQMLTLQGAAELYAATMRLAEATTAAFGLFLHEVALERLIADPEGETRALCDYLGLAPTAAAPTGLNTDGIGKWRGYETEMAPVMPLLAPWLD